MQFLFSVIDDHTGLAPQDEMAAIHGFNERLQMEGHWVFAGGLSAPSAATVIDNRGPETMFSNAPQASKEYISGLCWASDAGRAVRRRGIRTIHFAEAVPT